MTKNFPIRYIIHVAEDLRVEQGDKMSLMGLCQKGVDLIDHNGKLIAPSLAIYGLFYGVKGDFEGKIVIESKDGEKILEAPIPINTRDKSSDEDEDDAEHSKLLVAGKFMNVQFKSTAKCKVIIKFDDQEYSDFFSLKKPVTL